ncbi:serine protease SP24D-like, partial [Hylaeus anthracinus]|uniref:serine protease SP24D-like n=1 Tax=Hylaeus anthracinus TaxID=313031 RepID=UPI0023B9E345
MNSKSTPTFLFACCFLTLCPGVYSHIKENGLDKEVVSNSTQIKKDSEPSSPVSKLFFPSFTYDTDRIAGGFYAVNEQFPFMAVVHRLLPNGATSQCGGTVISKRWVLTAGHCIGSGFPRKFFVVFGIVNKSGIGYDSNNGPGVSMITSLAVVHPKHDYNKNDVGLLYMPQDIPYSQKIQPIRLACYHETRDAFDGMTGYVVGWGKDGQVSRGTKALKYALLPIIANDYCSKFWQIDEGNICTANGLGQNACQVLRIPRN